MEEEDEELVNRLATLVPAAEGQENVQRRNKLRRLGIVELVIVRVPSRFLAPSANLTPATPGSGASHASQVQQIVKL